jgi:hypothetical protein
MVLFDGPVQRDQGDVRRFAIITIRLGTDMRSIMVLKRFSQVFYGATPFPARYGTAVQRRGMSCNRSATPCTIP